MNHKEEIVYVCIPSRNSGRNIDTSTEDLLKAQRIKPLKEFSWNYNEQQLKNHFKTIKRSFQDLGN